ncbi:uncharacterized protein K02A2.6-like [Toxorhynchites rutilus septentrionalis]|uniref:uncharacterized protein K02A2.6-like n=1 Tax=Toxorhynchites rutilus septentrionalis TaxID=329112 RepID=UPI00247B2CD3|nr:uncharacterized protein K02A2.6-like [Toxorhynchites rutilus septentrionalis]
MESMFGLEENDAAAGDDGENGADEIFEDAQNQAATHTLAEIIAAFDEYCLPRKNIAMEAFKYNSIAQKEKQTFAEFETELRTQVQYCEFSCATCQTSYSDRMLRDRIIIGIQDKKLQLKLLDGRDDPLSKIIETCKIFEAASENKQLLDRKSNFLEVKVVSKEQIDSSAKTVDAVTRNRCYNCGRPYNQNHRRNCPASTAVCHSCGEIGHYSKCCRKKTTKQPGSHQQSSKSGRNEKTIHTVNWNDADWVSNMQLVEKSNGKLRICLDPKPLNRCIKREHFLIPTQEDLLSRLAGKHVFSVLDLSSGFWQMELDRKSSDLTTFMTPFGRYRWNRVPFGLNNAPEMFQRRMVQIFGDIPGVVVYFDDVLISGKDEIEHDRALAEVIKRAQINNVKFNAAKLQYRQAKVTFMGSVIDSGRTNPIDKDIRAITCMPKPSCIPDVARLLGLLKYLAKYIPNLSKRTLNLRKLTHHGAKWEWNEEHDTELKDLLSSISSTPTLAIYDPSKACIVQTDSFKDGLGCVLLQDHGPVAYASRTLTNCEQKWAQIEKELLAVVFACQRFHHFLYGREFTVQSDHKPLETLVKRDIDDVTPRLQRIEKTLSKARTQFFWPGMTNDLKELVSSCTICEKFRRNNCKEPLVQDNISEYPFQRVSTDIYEYGGYDWLVVIDAYSGFICSDRLQDKTIASVCKLFDKMFNCYGYPTLIRSDNVPFNSLESETYANRNNIKFEFSSPRYPQSNGLAEKAVAIAKNILKRCYEVGEVEQFQYRLLEYNTTPIASMKLSPSQLFFGRQIKTRLPMNETLLIRESLDERVVRERISKKRELQKQYYDRSAKKLPLLKVGDRVLFKKNSKEWHYGQIVRDVNGSSFVVRDNFENHFRRNRRFITQTTNNELNTSELLTEDDLPEQQHLSVPSPSNHNHSKSNGGPSEISVSGKTSANPRSRDSFGALDDLFPSGEVTARPSSSSTQNLHDSLQSHHSSQDALSPVVSPRVTRSGRTVIPPKRYGEWVV